MAERKYRSMREMQQDARAGAVPKGIPCLNCGSTSRRVFRTVKEDGMVVRETQCLDCYAKDVTKETRA